MAEKVPLIVSNFIKSVCYESLISNTNNNEMNGVDNVKISVMDLSEICGINLANLLFGLLTRHQNRQTMLNSDVISALCTLLVDAMRRIKTTKKKERELWEDNTASFSVFEYQKQEQKMRDHKNMEEYQEKYLSVVANAVLNSILLFISPDTVTPTSTPANIN